MYQNIPEELRKLPQWVCVAPNKEPINPFTKRFADINDPSTWASFDDAVEAANAYGIGFVFTASDPYAFIDLDDPYKEDKAWTPEQRTQFAELNRRIFNSVDTYAELSTSGKGIHLVCRGVVPTGARRDTVEVYSNQRYAIFTGNVVKALPIVDQQAVLDGLYSQMHKEPLNPASELVHVESCVSDDDVIRMGSLAANGDKFDMLMRGDWQGEYPSQSEADFALLSMLAFYSPSNDQVRKLFRLSMLGRRAKATRNDKYINNCLKKIRAGEAPPVDLSTLKLKAPPSTTAINEPQGGKQLADVRQVGPALGGAEAQYSAAPAPALDNRSSVVPPPGLMGRVAHYIYASAMRPVPEVALSAAIAFMAGICGRSWNISKTGLNQYVILIAPTGSGKEGAASGIDSLFREIRQTVPSVTQYKGPAVFSSGQGLLRVITKRPCFVSVLGEFGLTLQQLSSPRASSAEVMLRRALLDLYTKSGWGRILDEMVYSDTEKNTGIVVSPAVTLLGESTPSLFYENLEPADVESGLVPRFLLLESTGDGPPRNRNAGFAPDPELVKDLANLATQALLMQNNNTCQEVGLDEAGAHTMQVFEEMCDERRKDTSRSSEKEMWSRAYLKAIKLAGLVAVGNNPHNPVVTQEIAEWAVRLVKDSTEGLVRRFERGEVGTGEVQHESEVRKAIARYVGMTKAQKINAKCPVDCLDHDVIPFAYLRDQLRRRSCFTTSKMGLVRAVEVAIADAVSAGILVRVPQHQLLSIGVVSQCWARGSG